MVGQFFSPIEAYLSNLSLLLSLEPSEKFVVGGGWWLRVSLVLSFGLSQAEQKWTKMGVKMGNEK